MSENENSPQFVHTPEARRAVESLFDTLEFDELYELAVEVCLRRPPDAIDRATEQATSDERKLLAHLGARGLNAALDLLAHENLHIFPATDDEGVEMINQLFPLRHATPIDSIDIAGNVEVQDKIHMFGKAMLSESYECLGSDTDAMLERFKQAETDEEQLLVLDWLAERIATIGHDKTSLLDDPYEALYHPVRLSPKLLGQYPSETLSPTCLGKSVLATSFLVKTGEPTLHAGVMRTTSENDVIHLAIMSMLMAHNGNLPVSISDRLRVNGTKLYFGERDHGFHALGTVRLKSGKWYAIDTNYFSNYVIDNPRQIAELDSAYNDIQEFSRVSPDIERIVELNNGVHSMAVEEYVCGDNQVAMGAETALSVIYKVDLDEFQASTKAAVREALVSYKASKKFRKRLRKLLYQYDDDGLMTFTETRRESTIFDEAVETMLHEFVLWRESPVDMRERCLRDKAYLARRVADMVCLPRLVLLECARQEVLMDYAYMDGNRHNYHSLLEVGDPAYRVGASVISDFASYSGAETSPGFWLMNWSSRIPVTEHIVHTRSDSGYDGFVGNHFMWLAESLSYRKQHGIIEKSIHNRKVEDNGDQQG